MSFSHPSAAEEDIADQRRAAGVLERIEAGEEELIPGIAIDRPLRGEAPPNGLCERRRVSQAELERRSRVNRVQIIDIEAGRNAGSAFTSRKPAAALDDDLDEIASNLQRG